MCGCWKSTAARTRTGRRSLSANAQVRPSIVLSELKQSSSRSGQGQFAANLQFSWVVDVVPLRQIAMPDIVFLCNAPQRVSFIDHVRALAAGCGHACSR